MLVPVITSLVVIVLAIFIKPVPRWLRALVTVLVLLGIWWRRLDWLAAQLERL